MRMVVESRAHSAGSPAALRYWRLQCTPWHCSLYELYSLSLIHTAPREAAPPVQRPLPRLQLTGPRVSMQTQSGPTYRISENLNLDIKQDDIKQDELLFLCVPCSLRKTNLQRERKDWDGHSEKGRLGQQSPGDQSAGMFPRSQLPS